MQNSIFFTTWFGLVFLNIQYFSVIYFFQCRTRVRWLPLLYANILVSYFCSVAQECVACDFLCHTFVGENRWIQTNQSPLTSVSEAWYTVREASFQFLSTRQRDRLRRVSRHMWRIFVHFYLFASNTLVFKIATHFLVAVVPRTMTAGIMNYIVHILLFFQCLADCFYLYGIAIKRYMLFLQEYAAFLYVCFSTCGVKMTCVENYCRYPRESWHPRRSVDSRMFSVLLAVLSQR